jgi:hypothetical protein
MCIIFEPTPHIYFRGHAVVYGAALTASIGFYQAKSSTDFYHFCSLKSPLAKVKLGDCKQ